MSNPAVQRTMVKNVKIHAPIAIKTVNPTIYGDIEKTTMTPANIMKCLIGRATVWEILSDGSLLKMNEHNYNTVNNPLPKVAKTSQTLASEVNRSAVVDEDEPVHTTMILKDKVTIEDKVDIAPGTVEDLNKKIEDAGEIPSPKSKAKDEEPAEDSVDTGSDEDEMSEEDKELAELQAQIDALEEEENKN